MKAGTAHFVIAGDWLTDTCRRLWSEEDRPEAALKILMEGLPGITEAQAVSICEGRFKLTSDSWSRAGRSPTGPRRRLDTRPGS